MKSQLAQIKQTVFVCVFVKMILRGAILDWQGLTKYRIDLKLPLLIIAGSRGLLACGYLNVETFNKTGEVAAIVTGVKDFEAMLEAKVVKVSAAAAVVGITPGMSGVEVLAKIR